MDVDSYRGQLARLSTELYTGGELAAGSPGDKSEAERIAGIVEQLLEATARILEVPVAYWRVESVDLDPRPAWAAACPYSRGSAEGPVARVPGDASLPGAWRGFPRGWIALVDEPEDPDDVKYAALNAVAAGARALLVRREAPRKIAVNAHPGFSTRAGGPLEIPVVYVPLDYTPQRASVSVIAGPVESRSYIIEAGSGDYWVGAHYDRWYTGFTDNIVGIAQAAVLCRMLEDSGRACRLLVFGAEEHGAPGLASWYWAWGSRFYTRQYKAAGLLDAMAYVNFDTATGELVASGVPSLASLTGLRLREYECPECDSVNLAMAGVPTLSIHSLHTRSLLEVYHTPRDVPDEWRLRTAWEAVEAAWRALSQGPDWMLLARELDSILGRGPLEARLLNTIIQKAASDRGWPSVWRSIAGVLADVIHYGDLLEESSSLEMLYAPEAALLGRIREDIEAGRPPRVVYRLGEREDLLLYIGGNGFETVVRQARSTLAERLDAVRSILRR